MTNNKIILYIAAIGAALVARFAFGIEGAELAGIALFGSSGGGSSGGGGSQTTTQKTEPWEGQKDYLSDVYSRAQGLYNTPGPSYFQKSTVTPFSPETETALSLQTNRALAGNPAMNAANTELSKTLSGSYLSPDSNPYLKGSVDQALGDVRSMVGSQFKGNNFGSSAHEEWLNRKGIEAVAPIYAQNYQNERTNQMRGMMFAPSMAEADYNDIGRLASVGGAREGLSQQYLQDDINRWNYDQNLPYQKLGQYAGVVQNGSPGSSVTSTSPYYTNRGAGMLGGGMAGLTAASMFAGKEGLSPWLASNPWGWGLMAGGALLGGGLL